MPMNHVVDTAGNWILITAEGHVDTAAAIEAMTAVVEDPDYQPIYPVIVDLRHIVYDPAKLDAFTIANALGGFSKHCEGPLTLVVAPAVYTMANVACIMARAAGYKQIKASTKMPAVVGVAV